MAKAIHMMVRVLDAERSIDFYERAFGLTVADRFDFDDFTLVYLRNPEADFEVELTVNKGRAEPYDHGDAYGHVAFAVEDLDRARAVRRAGFCTQSDQGVPSRRRADGAFLFRAGPRRVQDRDAAAARPLPVDKKSASTESNRGLVTSS